MKTVKMLEKKMEIRLKHPFTCLVAGPTKAGKTTFVTQLIQHRNTMITVPPEKIWWCYSEYQPAYDKLKNDVTFVKGLVDISLIRELSPTPQLLILDDLMTELTNDTNLVELFTRGCHHMQVSVIHIVQNIFYKGLRTSRINTDYIILMKNPADKLQVQTLAKQLYPNNGRYFSEAYKDATQLPYSYLLVDLTQTSPDEIRLRGSIFSSQPIIYTPKV